MKPEHMVEAQILQHRDNRQFIRVNFDLDGSRHSSAPFGSYDEAMSARLFFKLEDDQHPERSVLFTPVKNVVRS